MEDEKIISYTYKNVWRVRNKEITKLIKGFNGSVLDLGCGDKDILNYFVPRKGVNVTRYVGLDRVDTADIVTNLNTEVVPLDAKFNLGLAIGVLEYLENPMEVLKAYKPFAERWIILTHHSAKGNKGLKQTWHHRFTPDDIVQFKKIFKVVHMDQHKTNLIWNCK
tara:strand:+ start:1608 stop:2102 length:495 start_codon:yes stop_codon:yes gene_type:complete